MSYTVRLILIALLTAGLETGGWACVAAFRTWRFLAAALAVNLVSNLLMNLAVLLLFRLGCRFTVFSWPVLALELAAAALEFGCLGWAAKSGWTARLGGLTLLMNLGSFLAGLLLT